MFCDSEVQGHHLHLLCGNRCGHFFTNRDFLLVRSRNANDFQLIYVYMISKTAANCGVVYGQQFDAGAEGFL